MGGAILSVQLSMVTVCGLVKNNSAIGNGGGIASMGKASLVLCDGIALVGNRAGGYGGGVYNAGASTIIGVQHFKPVNITTCIPSS